jgi:hypothetical protein
MRETAIGRAAISDPLEDLLPAVRLLAATHSLAWDKVKAERVLEELKNGSGPFAVDAKWTLRSFRSCKLNLDS